MISEDLKALVPDKEHLEWREHRGPRPSKDRVKEAYVYLFRGNFRGFTSVFYYVPSESVFMRADVFDMLMHDGDWADVRWYTAKIPNSLTHGT